MDYCCRWRRRRWFWRCLSHRYTYAPALLVGCPALAVVLFAVGRAAAALLLGHRNGDGPTATPPATGRRNGLRLPALAILCAAVALGLFSTELGLGGGDGWMGEGAASVAGPGAHRALAGGLVMAGHGPVALLRQRGGEWAHDGTKLAAMGGECAGLHGRKQLLPGYGRDLR